MLNDMGTIKWVKGSSHDISDWYFDPKTGRTLDKKRRENSSSLVDCSPTGTSRRHETLRFSQEKMEKIWWEANEFRKTLLGCGSVYGLVAVNGRGG